VQIAIPLFEDLTVLDATGPNEILGRLPGADVRFVGAAPGPVRSESAGLQLVVEHRYEDVPAPDVIVMPGGTGTRALLADERVLAWLRAAHATSTWTTSVCTGSLVLAAAGILDGVDATTHWLQRDLLGRLGANPVADRVVERGKIITAAGVSSGIDMALVLAERLAGPTSRWRCSSSPSTTRSRPSTRGSGEGPRPTSSSSSAPRSSGRSPPPSTL
jgi:transcriptional regulator GlxA family with amidase domain